MTEPERYLDVSRQSLAGRLLSSAAGDGPSEQSWQRALSAVVAASAATAITGTTTAAGPAATSGIALWLKWLGIGLVAGGITAVGGSVLVAPAPLRPSAPPAAPAAPAVPVPGAELSPGAPIDPPPAAPDPETESAEPARPARRATLPSASEQKPVVTDTLAREVARIDAARRRLSSGDARAALTELERYRSEFPRGHFGAEASLLRAESHLALGDCAAVRALAPSATRGADGGVLAKRWQSLLDRCR